MMHFNFDSPEPLYLQVAEQLKEAIFTGMFAEGDQVPSTTEISKDFHINPATVLKGMNLLVGEELLVKRRGLGTFVADGAAARIAADRRENFYSTSMTDLITEAKKLHLSADDLIALIRRGFAD